MDPMGMLSRLALREGNAYYQEIPSSNLVLADTEIPMHKKVIKSVEANKHSHLIRRLVCGREQGPNTDA